MQLFVHHKILSISVLVILGMIIFISVEFLYFKNNGKPVPAPLFPRDAPRVGKGSPLTYVVLGDSTAVGQGGKYEMGIAVVSYVISRACHSQLFRCK